MHSPFAVAHWQVNENAIAVGQVGNLSHIFTGESNAQLSTQT